MYSVIDTEQFIMFKLRLHCYTVMAKVAKTQHFVSNKLFAADTWNFAGTILLKLLIKHIIKKEIKKLFLC